MTAAQEAHRTHVVQGGYAVSGSPTACLTTVLGSCVSACIWDPGAGLGGMNHFLLPSAPEGSIADKRYGVQAMEVLINALLSRGARRDSLHAKVFGGARMTPGLADVGAKNGAFVRRFLQDEGIHLESASLGGVQARRVQFWPSNGRARQHLIDAAAFGVDDRKPVSLSPVSGDLELF
ncbi:MAG: chemotaxis protein CheD [Brevundimonas sp.]|uniref:chemotaxis protein CheD n=1 Tax=Brevundimonas sp. TaxID=1871086 RepID=UPI004033C2B8